jgi:hypothetical protein
MSVSFKRIIQATALAVPLVVVSPQLPAVAADSPAPVVAGAQCDQAGGAQDATQHCVKNAADLLAQANEHKQDAPAPAAEKPAPSAEKSAPAADKPAADKPAADKPAADPAPAADKPAADKPAADKPAADPAPAADKPAPVEGTKPAQAAPAPAADAPEICTATNQDTFHLDACGLLDQLGVTELLLSLGIDLSQVPIDLHRVLEIKRLLETMGIYKDLQLLPIGKLINSLGIMQIVDTVLPLILAVVGATYLLPGTPA